jgi:hypothetical protein
MHAAVDDALAKLPTALWGALRVDGPGKGADAK